MKEALMSDVFLSYSRKDTQFVREIFDTLNARKRETWIDLHAIDYSAKWWDEICSGIDGADNFVLFVSPNSLESWFCHREIGYALDHKKRIIPFLIEPIDEQSLFQNWKNHPDLSKYEQLTHENWKSIQAIQWIDFTAIKDVNEAVGALLKTVDTDPERVKLHTRLLLRLRDWESQGRNPSGLLRGEDLTQYEQWLADSRQKETPPYPTGEQEAYILESHRVQDELEAKRIQRERLIRRFRVASIVLGGFFLLAILATVVTINITNRAVNSANAQVAAGNTKVSSGNTQVFVIGQTLTPIPPQLTAVRQTVVAGSFMIESLNLSAEANSILRTEGGNAETAALLSIRVLRKLYLASADAALVDASHRLKAVPQVFAYRGNVSSVAFSPDGKRFVIGISQGPDTGVVELRDTASGSVIWSIKIKSANINGLAFSPDGKLVVAAAGDSTGDIFDAANGNLLHVLGPQHDIVERAVFSPDGKTILTLGGGSDRTVHLWNVGTGEQIYSVPAGIGATTLFFLPGGQSFYADGSVFNTADGSQIINSGIRGGTITIAPDGNTYVTGINPTAELTDFGSGQLIRSFSGHTDSVINAAFSGDGKWLVTGSRDNTARVWEVATGKQFLLLTGNKSAVEAVAFSPDGSKVLTGSDTARLWNLTGDIRQLSMSAPAGVTVSALAPDGKSIVAGDENGNATYWDLNTGKLLRTFSSGNVDVKSVAFSPDGQMVAIPACKNMNMNCAYVELYEASSGKLLKTFSNDGLSQPYIGMLSFSSDSKMLFVAYFDDSARLWDIASGQVLRQFNGNYPQKYGPTGFSPDGNLVVLDGGKTWWNISSAGPVPFPDGMRGNKIVFSADGSMVAILNSNNSVAVWEMTTQHLIMSVAGHTDAVKSLAFSPDNRLLLTGSADKTAMLWEIPSGRLLRVFTGHGASVTSVVFSPDGQSIVTTSEDKTIRTWITDYNDLLAYACTLVGVDLTPDERINYGVSGQEATCPQFGAESQPLVATTTPIATFTPLPAWTRIATPTNPAP
jgi:WD40 repeat protein